MLKVLFSPSEGKNSGGLQSELKLFGGPRDEILNKYKEIVLSADEERIKELFGIKKFSDCEQYIEDHKNALLLPAIERYSGVAYEYLDYQSLTQESKKYLSKNLIIFSNLFGPVLGGDTILNYKVKQGNFIGDIAPEKYYKERFSYQLDLELANCEILDLRAGYYDKFYKTNEKYTTLKFLKNGKTVSHWAKAYRGIVLRELALKNIVTLDDFVAHDIQNLKIKEIKTVKNKTEIIYDILED